MGARFSRAVLVVVLVVAVVVPGVAFAAGGFTDTTDSVFKADIDWLAGAGVTKGCNPPTNDRFCPNENVTRGQMAAFMRRFAQFLGAEDGVVSMADYATTAGSAATAGHATTAESATTAGDADTVDGLHAADLLAASPTVTLVSNDNDFWTSSTSWVDVPGMTVTVTVPPGENRDAVITFSAESQCFDWIAGYCHLQVAVDDSVAWQGRFDTADHSGGWDGYGAHSVQAFATDLAPGSHTVTVQYKISYADEASFWLDGMRLSVMTFPVSQVSSP